MFCYIMTVLAENNDSTIAMRQNISLEGSAHLSVADEPVPPTPQAHPVTQCGSPVEMNGHHVSTQRK